MLYPLTFHPIFKDRVWGGRKLQELYGKPLPPERPIGESWEISDRPGDVSVIANGPLAGKDLHWLMKTHGQELLGSAQSLNGRFPLLIKILDAQEKLSLQVHPPPHKAATLGGEPKTEMWYIADAAPHSELYVGLKRGVGRQQFEEKVEQGTVAECFHRLKVQKGDAIFLPSGRVHAIGAGLVIFEIQQNSDTTYRVFDWNRVGLDGKPRELHVLASLESIDFDDFEPELINRKSYEMTGVTGRTLVDHHLFNVTFESFSKNAIASGPRNTFRIIGLLSGKALAKGGGQEAALRPGDFCLIPASLNDYEFFIEPGTSLLRIDPGR